MKRSMEPIADAVNHDRALAAAVHIHILQVEVQRHLEVQLNRAALPGTTEAVAQVEVNLRAVERTVALVDDVGHTELFQRGFEAVGCDPPNPRPNPCESAGRVDSSTK